jgi:hypothetical protein
MVGRDYRGIRGHLDDDMVQRDLIVKRLSCTEGHILSDHARFNPANGFDTQEMMPECGK